MFRKISITLLSLALALMLPLQAMATTMHTFSVTPGPAISQAEQGIADLCKTASIKLFSDEKSAALVLTLDDTDVLSAAMTANKDGLYVQSAAIADEVLYFTWDELLESALSAAVSYAASNNAPLDEATITALGNNLEIYKQAIEVALEQSAVGTAQPEQDNTTDFDLESIQKTYQAQLEAYPDMYAIIEDILKRSTLTEGAFTSDLHDTATTKVEIPVDTNDIIKMCDTKFMRDNMTGMTDSNGQPISAEDAIAQAKKVLLASDFTSTTTVLYDSKTKEVIAYEIPLAIKITRTSTDADLKATPQVINASLKFVYNRLTTDAGVSHKADFVMDGDNKRIITAAFDYAQNTNNTSHGVYGMLVDNQEVSFVYDGALANGVQNRSVALYMRNDASSLLAPADADRPIITFNLSTQDVDTPILDGVNAATTTTATRVPTMSAEQKTAFEEQMQTRLMQVVLAVFSKIPASLLTQMQE